MTSTQGLAVGATTNTLTNAGSGTLSPGYTNNGGRTAITGNYSVTSASASYAVEIGSATAATAFQSGAAFYDNTTVSGTVALGGLLNVSLISGFTPTTQTFTILTGSSITGTFSNVSGGKVTLPGGATFDVTNTGTAVTLSNYQSVVGGSTYASWQAQNGPTSQTIDQDHDSDGVSNGVEYFIGGASNTTGFTALPAIVTVGSVQSITFTYAASYTGVYGTDYVIETSASLAAGSWVVAPGGTVTFPTSNTVKYTFPAGVINFARLRVTGP